jgi:hypothetical protein
MFLTLKLLDIFHLLFTLFKDLLECLDLLSAISTGTTVGALASSCARTF